MTSKHALPGEPAQIRRGAVEPAQGMRRAHENPRDGGHLLMVQRLQSAVI